LGKYSGLGEYEGAWTHGRRHHHLPFLRRGTIRQPSLPAINRIPATVSSEPSTTTPMVRAPRTQETPWIPATQIPSHSSSEQRRPLPPRSMEEEDITDVDVPVEQPPRHRRCRATSGSKGNRDATPQGGGRAACHFSHRFECARVTRRGREGMREDATTARGEGRRLR
jgi:hypothetical protein